MDKTDALKSLIAAASQHANSSTEQNLMELQRSLDVLIGLTTTADLDLDPHCLLITEAFSVLLHILLTAELKPGLAQRVITLLQNLATNSVFLEILQSAFNIHSIITTFLLNIVNTEVLFGPCLSLLSSVTYNVQIVQVDGNLENLINLLIANIENSASNVETLCLSILNHICQRNTAVQLFIRNMKTSKQIYKTLIGKLSHPCLYNVINSLSILASLILDNEIGDKLFSAKNISKTFQLIFNLAVSEDHLAKRAAIDLLLNLIKSSSMLENFTNYKYLMPSLKKLLDTLTKESAAGSSLLVLKLILGFICIPHLRLQICSLICPNEEMKNEVNFIPKLICWIDKSVIKSETPILAIQLIKNVIEEYINKGYIKSLDLQENYFNCIVQEIHNISTSESSLVKREYEKLISLLDLFIIICKEQLYKKQVVKIIDLSCLKRLVIHHLAVSSLYVANDFEENSEFGIDLILAICAFLDTIKDSVDVEEVNKTIIENENVSSLLSFAISSDNPTRVSRGITLAVPYTFLCDILAQTIATNNSLHQTLRNTSAINISKDDKNQTEVFKINMHHKSENLDKSVQDLMDKLQNGLDVKDLKSSEIMEVYDYKISTLIMKTQQLQDIVDTKSTLLQQADNLLCQHRCQQAQQEAEALKLRTLLKQMKFQNEKAEEKHQLMMEHQAQLDGKLECAQQTIEKLEKQLDEQHDVNIEQSHFLESTQKALENLQIEYNAISEMNAMLQKHTESLKQKQDTLTQELADVINEKKIMSKQLREKENSIKGMGETIQKLEESLQHKAKEYEILLKKETSVTLQLEETLSNKLRLEEQLSLLEKSCKQHETTISENSVQIRKLTEQLQHHKQITEMIHNLSTVPVSKKNNS